MNCLCGCGVDAGMGGPKLTTVLHWLPSHYLRGKPISLAHRKKIGETQRKTWAKREGKRKPPPLGSTFINKAGYVQVKMVSGPFLWILEHHLIVEQSLGRALRKDEVVHHIDGQKTNNNLTNLFLCTRKQHMLLHQSLDQLIYQLIQDKSIRFEGGRYFLQVNSLPCAGRSRADPWSRLGSASSPTRLAPPTAGQSLLRWLPPGL